MSKQIPTQPTNLKAVTKIIPLNIETENDVEKLEQTIATLLNNGYRPLIATTTLAIFVKAVEVTVK